MSLEAAPKKQTSAKQTRLAQPMFEWQNVGTQKEKIENVDNKCPTKCGAVEVPCHYLM